MTKFMLDTNTVSYMMRGVRSVVDNARRHKPSELCISAITLAELRYGAEKAGSERLHQLIDTLLMDLRVESFGPDAAASYGRVAAALNRSGKQIGPLDTQIAAHALAIGATIVTNNTKHFKAVPHLKITNWT